MLSKQSMFMLVLLLNVWTVKSWNFYIVSHTRVKANGNGLYRMNFIRNGINYDNSMDGWSPQILLNNLDDGEDVDSILELTKDPDNSRYYFAMESEGFEVHQKEKDFLFNGATTFTDDNKTINLKDHLLVKVYIFDSDRVVFEKVNSKGKDFNYPDDYMKSNKNFPRVNVNLTNHPICSSFDYFSDKQNRCDTSGNYPYMLGDRMYFFLGKGEKFVKGLSLRSILKKSEQLGIRPFYSVANYKQFKELGVFVFSDMKIENLNQYQKSFIKDHGVVYYNKKLSKLKLKITQNLLFMRSSFDYLEGYKNQDPSKDIDVDSENNKVTQFNWDWMQEQYQNFLKNHLLSYHFKAIVFYRDFPYLIMHHERNIEKKSNFNSFVYSKHDNGCYTHPIISESGKISQCREGIDFNFLVKDMFEIYDENVDKELSQVVLEEYKDQQIIKIKVKLMPKIKRLPYGKDPIFYDFDTKNPLSGTIYGVLKLDNYANPYDSDLQTLYEEGIIENYFFYPSVYDISIEKSTKAVMSKVKIFGINTVTYESIQENFSNDIKLSNIEEVGINLSFQENQTGTVIVENKIPESGPFYTFTSSILDIGLLLRPLDIEFNKSSDRSYMALDRFFYVINEYNYNKYPSGLQKQFNKKEVVAVSVEILNSGYLLYRKDGNSGHELENYENKFKQENIINVGYLIIIIDTNGLAKDEFINDKLNLLSNNTLLLLLSNLSFTIYISPKSYSSKFSDELFEFKRENFKPLDLGTEEIRSIKRRRTEELKALEREKIMFEVEQKKISSKQVIQPEVHIKPSQYGVEYSVIHGSEIDNNRSLNLTKGQNVKFKSTSNFNAYDQSPQMGNVGNRSKEIMNNRDNGLQSRNSSKKYDILEKNKKALERMKKKREQNEQIAANMMDEEERLILI